MALDRTELRMQCKVLFQTIDYYYSMYFSVMSHRQELRNNKLIKKIKKKLLFVKFIRWFRKKNISSTN